MTTESARQPVTPRQREVYDYVEKYIETNGFSPTRREIQHAFGFRTLNAVMSHLLPLRKKGWLNWIDNTARTIRCVPHEAEA